VNQRRHAHPKRSPRDGDPAGGAGPEGFTLRFALGGQLPASVYDDARLESLRRQIAALLDIVILTRGGQPVEVDGFKLVSEVRSAPENTYRIFPSRPRKPQS
jgi:hypothetical protein